jgi:CheY-like chemotaxis protein
MEEVVNRSNKMVSLGELASGMTHDFNNVLFSILMSLEFVLEELPPDHPARPDAEAIRTAVNGASSLTKPLLAFGRRQAVNPEVLVLNETIEGFKTILERTLGSMYSIKTDLAVNLQAVKADAGQIQQILMNLSVNARDAMPRGGELTIETNNVDVPEKVIRPPFTLEAGRYVRLSVTDKGCGMSQDVLTRVFEPFFTTKPKGLGTGLGLSMVYGIVEQSGGTVWIDSLPGQGTSVRIYLPRWETPVNDREPVPATNETSIPTILVADDEECIRVSVTRVLQSKGYRVLTASDGSDACRIGQSHEGKIDLILTDVMMPGLNGPDVAGILRHSRRDMRVLFMSGQAQQAIAHRGPDIITLDVLKKPFTLQELLGRVRDALAQAPEPFETFGLPVGN